MKHESVDPPGWTASRTRAVAVLGHESISLSSTLLCWGAICWLLFIPSIAQAQRIQSLDTTTFVVLGEGLAAGMANYGLSSIVQDRSFPSQVARQIPTAFPQPLMEPPGIGDVLGYPRLPLRLPKFSQGRIREYPAQSEPNDETPTLFVFNLSVPGLTVLGSISHRPSWPLLQRDTKQTVINLILGFPSLLQNHNVPQWTQLEYAQAMMPTVALIELGYYEALDGMVAGDPSRIPDAAAFRTGYAKIVAALRSQQAQVIVTTIPDPTQTAYLSTLSAAEAILKLPAGALQGRYRLREGDFVTRDGLTFIGNQITRGLNDPLPPGSVLAADIAGSISARVGALNGEIRAIASQSGAVVYDLASFFQVVRLRGVAAGSFQLTAGYLGGFYSLDGYYPGITGHTLIANDLLLFLNRTYSRSFPLVDIGPVIRDDPGLQSTIDRGDSFKAAEVSP